MFGRRKNKTNSEETQFSFRKYAWKQFKKNRAALVSFYFLCFMIFIALFASFIANDQPLYAKYKGKTYYPAFNQHWLFKSIFQTSNSDTIVDASGTKEILQYDITEWKQLELESVVWALVPFSPDRQDVLNRDFASPSSDQFSKNHKGEISAASGKFRHRLGTDVLGRDVLAGIIHGTKIALLVGIVSMGIAVLVGIFLGAVAGYFGDHRLRMCRMQILLLLFGILLGYFYAFVAFGQSITLGFEIGFWTGMFRFLFNLLIFITVPVLFTWLGKKIAFGWFRKEVYLPLDAIISRFIEIFNSMPRLLLIISISAVVEERSLWLVMVIIGLTSWTEIARFTRAELLKVRELDFISAARSLGLSDKQIIFRHALPNALAPVFVSIAFGIAAAILIESGLSFLNIGVPDDVVTWGSMLNIGRTEPEAWWMIVFPGLAIFFTITVYNLIGEGLRDALDPKLKR